MPGIMEVEFAPGVWTDVSAYTKPGVKLSFGVSSWDDDGQAGQIDFTLENYDGRFTPDNPTSPYWPNVQEGIRCRWSITRSAVNYPRGVFFVKAWTLNTSEIARLSTVTVTALDKLASLSRRTMNSDYLERYRYVSEIVTGGNWFDAWPMIQEGRPRRPHNVGFGPNPVSATAVDPKAGRGACSYEDPSPLILEGAFHTTPNTFLGPVCVMPSQADPVRRLGSLAFWFKVPVGTEPPLDDFAVLASAWDANNECVFRFAIKTMPGETVPRLELQRNIDPDTGVNSNLLVVDKAPVDGAWHSVYFASLMPGNTGILFYDSFTSGAFSSTTPTPVGDTVTLVMGGDMAPNSRGSMKPRTVPMSFAGVVLANGYADSIEKYAQNNAQTTADSRFLDDYRNWAPFTGAYSGPTGQRQVMINSSSGRTVTDALQELARTTTGLAWVRYADDTVELIDGTNMRPTTVSLTLTVGPDDDLDAGQTWRRGALENPTRQTVRSPAGDGTFVDTAFETGRERRDGSDVDAVTVSPADSRALAAWYVRRGRRLRLNQFGIDVTTAVQDLWPFVLTQLKPGVRVRVDGLEPTQFGYTYRDVHVMGWEETWDELEGGEQACRINFDTVPADTPAETIFDDTTQGRYDFDGVAATIPVLTSSATSVVITSTGPALSSSAGEYPLYLNLDGETVQVTSAPASSTSPQTVTIVRGVLGSVARAHAAGTTVQVYPQAGFGA